LPSLVSGWRGNGVVRGGNVLLRQADRNFLSWLPDPVDSAVRQLDSTQVASFMVSYYQDRNISSTRRPWFFTEGSLVLVASGVSSAVHIYTEGVAARAAVNSVGAGPISHE
jgi:hypothetical protein